MQYLGAHQTELALAMVSNTVYKIKKDLPGNVYVLGMRELCWNNFRNNYDGVKESRIIPEF